MLSLLYRDFIAVKNLVSRIIGALLRCANHVLQQVIFLYKPDRRFICAEWSHLADCGIDIYKVNFDE